jgi:hypothetical protein
MTVWKQLLHKNRQSIDGFYCILCHNIHMTKPITSTPESEYADWYEIEHSSSPWPSDYEEDVEDCE